MHLQKKSFILIFIVVITASTGLISFSTACNNSDNNTNYAEWRVSNNQPYLYAKADDYYTLGYLEGQNLAFQTAWMKLMIMLQAQELGLSYDIAVYYSLEYLDYIPEEYILEIQGIADAIDVVYVPFMGQLYEISIDFMDVLAQNCFWDIYYGKIIPILTGYPQPPLIVGGCTGIASKTRSSTVLGQTLDFSLLMQPTASWVYTKINGKKAFSFRLGSMLAMGGVNRYGISVSVNLLEVLNVGCAGKPLSIVYRDVLENANTVRKAENIILTNDFTLGWNYIIRGISSIVAIETIPNAYSIERVKRNQYAFDANIYENELFKMFMIFPTKYVERYNRVSELCQTYSQDGRLTYKDISEIYTDSLISRRFTSPDPLSVGTVGFFFVRGIRSVYFGLGNPADSPLGVITRFN